MNETSPVPKPESWPSDDQIRDLTRRLAEAEATIQALLTDQVDAMIDPANAPPILLRQTQEALRALEVNYRRLSAELEQRVRERTAQLEAANRALQKEIAERQQLAIDNARLYDEAQRLNAELEQRVQQRMAELRATNQQLESEIGERRRTEVALRESKAMFEGLFESAPDAILAVDRRGRIVLVNRQAEKMFGYRREEILGRLIELLLPERFHKQHMAHRRRYLGAPRPQRMGENLEIFARRKDGGEFPVDVTLGPLASGPDLLVLTIVRDITDRKQAEIALRQSEARFAKIFHTSPVAICVTTLDEGRFLDVNESYLKMLEYRREEVIGHTSTELNILTNPEERPHFTQVLREQKSVYNIESNYRTKSGRICQTLASAEVIDLGDEACILTLIYDITERKEAEAALRASEERFRQLAENIREVFWITSAAENQLIYISPAYEEIWGRPRRSLDRRPQSLLTAIHPEDRQRAQALFSAQSQTELSGEYRVVQPSGMVRWIWARTFPIRDEQGHIYRMAGIAEDVTERKRTLEALQESQRFIQRVTDATPNVLYVYDLRQQRNVYVNREISEVLGYTPAEIQTMGATFLSALLHPDDGVVLEKHFQRCSRLQEGEISEIECRLQHINGEWRWLYSRDTVFTRTASGEAHQILGIAQDITERKRMEAELAEVQRRLMESREAERSRLAQELHDGPVQDLYGVSYQLKGLSEALPSEASQAQLAAIQAMLHQVIQMLRTTFSELRPPTLAPFGLEKAIRSHVEHFRTTHPALQIKLELMPDRQTLPEQMRLVLFRIYQEMLNNVIRHAQAQQVVIRFTLDAEEVVLEAQDDGRGFEVPQRWIKFARGGHLGLVSMSERVEAIGGQLKIISTPEVGTTIRVVAPLPEPMVVDQKKEEAR